MNRAAEVVRRLLALEPVVVQAVWRAIVLVLTTAGVVVSDAHLEQGLAIIGAVYVLAEAVGTVITRARAVPLAATAARVSARSGVVVAGPAADVPSGTPVNVTRDLGPPPSDTL